MIKRYIFGTPIETDAVIEKPCPDTCGDLFLLCASDEADRRTGVFALYKAGNALRYEMSEDDIIYGLGENVRGINKRGWKYISSCTDEPGHHEDVASLYGAHNFLMVEGGGHKPFGIFIDTPARVVFDVGYTSYDWLMITVESEDFELYLIEEKTPIEVVRSFRGRIGQPFLPPKWAFGYGQSRWSYRSSAEVREVAAQFHENQIPIDSIYLDIDYMEGYKDFTIDREHFPDFEELVEDLRQQGIHLVPIIDGGVKVEKGYEVFEEGVEKGYFCKDENGENFAVGVWPGICYFPDMLNEEAGKWFGHKYQFLLEKGIDGFWNDMNEPAIFYSQRRLTQLFDKMKNLPEQEFDIGKFYEIKTMVEGMEHNEEDYRSFYHNYRGQRIRHDQVHNLFGYYMTRSASEAIEEMNPEKRVLLFSRSSYIGMHRYGGIWMGDNKSWWSHLLMSLKMLPSLNMCGFLYTGPDIGGFGCDVTEDLLLRWLALGIFMPLMRNHSAIGTRRQEPYAFEHTEAFAGIIGLRYRLLPYLYSEFMKAALKNELYAIPLGFLWSDDAVARRVEDQLMIGESIMIAPVYEQNASGRTVYLPEEMKLVRFAGTEMAGTTVLSAGHHYIEIALNEVVIFIRKGHILPLSSGGKNTQTTDWEHLECVHFGEAGDAYELYDDDGESRKATLEGHIRRILA